MKYPVFLFSLLLTINSLLMSQTFPNKVVLQQQLGRDDSIFLVRATNIDESGLLWNTSDSNSSQWLVSIDGKPYDIRDRTWLPYSAQVKGAEKTLFFDDSDYFFIQELNILEGQQYATLTLFFINNSENTIILTPSLFLDTNFGDGNGDNGVSPLFVTTGKLIENEEELTGLQVPTWVQIPGGPSDSILTFIFFNELSEKPQKLKMANYFRFKANIYNRNFAVDRTRNFQTRHRSQMDKALLLTFSPRPVLGFSKDEVIVLFGIDNLFSGNESFPKIREILMKDSESLTPQNYTTFQEQKNDYLDEIDALIKQADAMLEGKRQIDDESVEGIENRMDNLQKRMSEK